ncbi:MAG: T9SS type A sorting domain-containing protein, partial [Bacteroidota bacterium]
DTSIGLIDSLGFFKGKANGETKVISKYGANSDTAEISVQIIEGTKLLHSFESLSGFGFSGENIDLVNSRIELVNSPITEGNGSFKVTYQFTGDPQKLNYLHFGTDMPLEAVPELLSFDLQTNGRKNHIRYYIQDYNDNEFMIAVKKWADKTTVLDPQPGVLKDATAIISGKVLIYPVSLKRIEIKLDSPRELGTVYRDSLFMDNLFVKYPGVTVGVEDEILHPKKFTLFQNYPNPFNPRTVIKFQVPSSKLVKLQVYDILGREIKTLVNEYKSQGTYGVQFNADELASGVYFYRLISGSFAATKKMLLIR